MLKEQKCHQSFPTFFTISGEEWPEKKLQQLEASAIPGPKKNVGILFEMGVVPSREMVKIGDS